MGFLRFLFRSAHDSAAAQAAAIEAHASSPLHLLPKPLLVLIAIGCLVMAACVAGLTLGLMTLDTVGLEIMMQSKNLREADAARTIMPVRKNAHLLLVTLLLGNTIATELLPLVLEVLYPGGVFALLLSVFSIMLFGEIIPQAVCSRHALEIGSRMIGFVKVLQVVLYPIAGPIAYMLDTTLGHELGTIYSREELKGLVDIHGRSKYGTLTRDETMIIRGTLDFSQRCVTDVLTKRENVFSLSVDAILDAATLRLILEKGHSRIPLYDKSPDNIICTLLVKQLLLVDPAEKLPIRSLIASRKRRRVVPVIECSQNTLIADMLNEFQTGQSHLGVVYDDVSGKDRKFLGILTIEDIIEEILQEEIVDETDVFVDNTNTSSATRQRELDRIARVNITPTMVSRVPGTRAILFREVPKPYLAGSGAVGSGPLSKAGSYSRRTQSESFAHLRGNNPAESAPLLGLAGPAAAQAGFGADLLSGPEEKTLTTAEADMQRGYGSDSEVNPVAATADNMRSPMNRIGMSPALRPLPSSSGSVKMRPLPTYVPLDGQGKQGKAGKRRNETHLNVLKLGEASSGPDQNKKDEIP